MTYLQGANLNGNLTFTRNSINTVPRKAKSAMSGYVGYSFRNTYALYLYMNRSRQETPTAGATTIENAVRTPRSWTGQLQVKLSPKANLIFSYSRSTAFVSGSLASKANTMQIIFHGQF
jgi:hypothetical protein